MASMHWSMIAVVAFYCLKQTGAVYSDVEARLGEVLLSNYSRRGRPIESNAAPVVVEFDMKLHKIEKLITKEQHLIIHSFVTMRWKDPRFVWNPADYNGTELINLEREAVWRPDIVLYNSADIDNNGPDDIYKAPVHVYSNGQMVWFATVVWQSTCAVDVTWFPVDVQTCDLVFGSWSYSKSRLKLTFHKIPIKFSDFTSNQHVTNGEWTVRHLSAKTDEHHYDCCHEPVSRVTYSISLKRRPLYFFLYLIFPVIALVLLSLLVFKIPAQCGERVGFAVTLLLTMGVYLVVISKDLPQTADNAPLVGVLYVTLFYVMVLGVLTGTMNARMAYKMTPPPDWLYEFVLKMKEKKCTKLKIKIASWKSKISDLKAVTELQDVGDNPGYCEGENRQEGDESAFESTSTTKRIFVKSKSSHVSLREAIPQVTTEQENDNQLKWQEIADFSDHVFFWLYFFLIVVSSLSVMLGLQVKKGLP